MLIAGYILFSLACGVLLLVAWNVVAWPALREDSGHSGGHVSVLIPARNEARTLGGCLESVLGQGPAAGEVVVYDDHSSDRTTDVIHDFQKRDPRIRLLEPEALPQGWCGKNFACARLAAAAQHEWLLFLDADARLKPGAVDRMLCEARARNVTLLSCWPGFDMVTAWERLLMPMLNFVVFSLFPGPLSLQRWDATLGLAHGACILVQRDAYTRVGGHETVRSEVFEDTRIARVWRQRGERGVCVDGQDAVRVHMYGSLHEIWRGFRKNLYPAFHHGTAFWLFLAFHGLVFLVPFVTLPIAIASGTGWTLFSGAALSVLAARILLALRFRQPLWSAFAHPAVEAMFLGLGIDSWWRCATGRGVDWKGRLYRASR